MWDNLTRAISVYWNRVLQNIEPQIIRSIHFLESILWGISTEIFGELEECAFSCYQILKNVYSRLHVQSHE